MKAPWRYAVIVLLAILPLLAIGWFLLKSAEDSLIAGKVRSDEQAHKLMELHAQELERSINQENERFLDLSKSKEKASQLMQEPKIAMIRWPELNDLTQRRSSEVSEWLLEPDENLTAIKNWLKTDRAQFRPAFQLFVIQQAGLEQEFTAETEELSWVLDHDDTRGIPLHQGITIRWDLEALLVELTYQVVSQGYTVEVRGLGEPAGLVQVIEEEYQMGQSYRNLLLLSCLLWVLVILLGLVFYARKKEVQAEESLDQLSAVAHELRTPLTGMQLLLEKLSVSTNETDQSAIGKIEEERKRLESLMEQFLVQGKLQRQSLSLQLTEWQQWLSDEYDRYVESHATSSTFKIEKLPAHETSLFIDRALIGVVLSNLLKNAVQHGEASEIRLREVSSPNCVGFEICDDGVGMSESLQKRVFMKYERGDQSYIRNTDGLGLGLSLVKEIVELHQGEVILKSSPNEGACVRVVFPLSPE